MSCFSERLAQERKRLGYSQEDLSKKSGVTQQAISMIESGKRSPTETTMTMLASGLGCSVGYLLGETSEYGKTADQVASGVSEEEMLILFRQLSPEKKEYVRGILEGLSAAHKL